MEIDRSVVIGFFVVVGSILFYYSIPVLKLLAALVAYLYSKVRRDLDASRDVEKEISKLFLDDKSKIDDIFRE